MTAARSASWLAALVIIGVSQFAQWYRLDPRAMLDAEQMNLWISVDFVSSFVYRLDESGTPVRPALRRLFGDRIPPLTLRSPHRNGPYVPAKELVMLPEDAWNRAKPYSRFYPKDRLDAIRPFEVIVPRPLGGNLGVPLPHRTFRGIPKTWWNIGIQHNAPATPLYAVAGLCALLLGQDISGLSLNLINPVIASRLPNMLLGTLTCLLVFAFARFMTGSRGIALAAGLFQALEPVSLAESRTNKTDTGIACFVALTLLLYYLGHELHRRRLKWWSGLSLGLAMLTKLQVVAVPVAAVAWRASLRWFRDRWDGLDRLRVPALLGFMATLALAGCALALWRYLPRPLQLKLGDAPGFTITLVGSLVFLALVFLALLAPVRRTAKELSRAGGALERWCAGRASWRLSGLAGVLDRTDAQLALLALLVFFVGLPNLWGDPLRGFWQHWVGFWGHIGANPFRAWFFVTPTVFPPVYFYLIMIPLHAHPWYLLALIAGLMVAINTLRKEPLRASRRSRGLCLILCWLISYFLLTASGGSYKKMQIATSFYPWLSMLAGLGAVALIQRAAKTRRLSDGTAGWLAGALTLGCMLPTVWTHWPYYHLYVTPLLGDPNRLSRIEWLSPDSVTGYERVADYLKSIGKDGAAVAAVGTPYNLAFVYPNTRYGDLMTPEDLEPSGCEFVAIHIAEEQRSPRMPLVQYFSQRQPVHIVTINGIDVIRVYRVGA